ncbi:MAG TPA: sigma factor-like helix-turn-helix DNA-binding protein [Actinospica sp.]|nr:sigma factor-like helix-turn-helix DNA-binding protein [Actinospica sp.]
MGDEEFDAFFSVSYSRLVGQLYALTGGWAEARETVLEAFTRAWAHRARFDLQVEADSWIHTVAWNLAGSRRREPGAEEPYRVAFVEALRGLGREQRRAMVLHHLCRRDVADIAAETGVSPAAVRAHLARGRAAVAAASGDGSHSTVERLVDELYDLVNQHAYPRLSPDQVRERSRRSATIRFRRAVRS